MERELILLGYLAFFDAPKKSADAAIAHLKRLHVEVKVLTGDQQDVAISICRRLNLKTQEVMTGNDFESLSDDEKRLCLERVQVFVELSPKHKVDIVRLLQKNGHTVALSAMASTIYPQLSSLTSESLLIRLLRQSRNVLM